MYIAPLLVLFIVLISLILLNRNESPRKTMQLFFYFVITFTSVTTLFLTVRKYQKYKTQPSQSSMHLDINCDPNHQNVDVNSVDSGKVDVNNVDVNSVDSGKVDVNRVDYESFHNSSIPNPRKRYDYVDEYDDMKNALINKNLGPDMDYMFDTDTKYDNDLDRRIAEKAYHTTQQAKRSVQYRNNFTRNAIEGYTVNELDAYENQKWYERDSVDAGMNNYIQDTRFDWN